MDIFINAIARDFEWMRTCLAVISVSKSELFRQVILVYDPTRSANQLPLPAKSCLPIVLVQAVPPQTCELSANAPNRVAVLDAWRTIVSLCWCRFTDADAVLLVEYPAVLEEKHLLLPDEQITTAQEACGAGSARFLGSQPSANTIDNIPPSKLFARRSPTERLHQWVRDEFEETVEHRVFASPEPIHAISVLAMAFQKKKNDELKLSKQVC